MLNFNFKVKETLDLRNKIEKNPYENDINDDNPDDLWFTWSHFEDSYIQELIHIQEQQKFIYNAQQSIKEINFDQEDEQEEFISNFSQGIQYPVNQDQTLQDSPISNQTNSNNYHSDQQKNGKISQKKEIQYIKTSGFQYITPKTSQKNQMKRNFDEYKKSEKSIPNFDYYLTQTHQKKNTQQNLGNLNLSEKNQQFHKNVSTVRTLIKQLNRPQNKNYKIQEPNFKKQEQKKRTNFDFSGKELRYWEKSTGKNWQSLSSEEKKFYSGKIKNIFQPAF